MSNAAVVEQLMLFDVGPNISELRSRSESFLEVSMSPRSVRAYSHSWSNFERWCVSAGRSFLPASEESVALFLTWCLHVKGSRLETVKLAVSAINWRHRASGLLVPVCGRDNRVRTLLRCAARELCEEPRGKLAITPDHVRAICRALVVDPSPLDCRDRALLLLGFATGCRRSELAALRLSDVSFVAHGLRVYVRRSKVDQVGKGRVVGVPPGLWSPTCPVRAVRSWLDVRGDWRGPLFARFSLARQMERASIRPEAVNVVVKRLLSRHAGVDPALYGAHGMRAGCATAAVENGAGEISIMRRVGWTSVSTVARYVRPAHAFTADPLAGVL